MNMLALAELKKHTKERHSDAFIPITYNLGVCPSRVKIECWGFLTFPKYVQGPFPANKKTTGPDRVNIPSIALSIADYVVKSIHSQRVWVERVKQKISITLTLIRPIWPQQTKEVLFWQLSCRYCSKSQVVNWSCNCLDWSKIWQPFIVVKKGVIMIIYIQDKPAKRGSCS